MEATSTRPSYDEPMTYSAAWSPLPTRSRLRVFLEERVVVISEEEGGDGPSVMSSIEAAAVAAERALDDECGARFFGASWHLVQHCPRAPEPLVLVVFAGLDPRGGLRDPEQVSLPLAMGWLAEALG